MCAKPARKNANKTPPPATGPAPAAPAAAAPAAAASAGEPAPAWIDSNDPRKRMFGKIVLVGVWVYVAALCLLALDQTFHWGIFGPKVPPVP